MNVKAIYFDMDGTIADLYGVDNWLPMLRREDPTPYEIAKPLVDMQQLDSMLSSLISAGIHVGVISWASKNSSSAYQKVVEHCKREWVAKYLPSIEDVKVVSYGINKHEVASIQEYAIIIDDDALVRESWDCEDCMRFSIHPNNMLEFLSSLF